MRRMISGLRHKREFLAGLVAMMLVVCGCGGSCGEERLLEGKEEKNS